MPNAAISAIAGSSVKNVQHIFYQIQSPTTGNILDIPISAVVPAKCSINALGLTSGGSGGATEWSVVGKLEITSATNVRFTTNPQYPLNGSHVHLSFEVIEYA